MKTNDIIQAMTQRATFIWVSLLMANCLFCYLVYSEILTSTPGDDLWIYILTPLTIIFSALSFIFDKKTKNIEALKNKLHSLDIEVPNLHHYSDELVKQFQNLTDTNKKKFKLSQVLLTYSVISLAMAESVNVFAICCLFLGMPVIYYYGFFILSILLMIIAFPHHKRTLDIL